MATLEAHDVQVTLGSDGPLRGYDAQNRILTLSSSASPATRMGCQ